MPLIEYAFIDLDGNDVVVEKLCKMNEVPETMLIEHQGVTYYAEKVAISRTAKMGMNWQVRGTASDLPAENTPA